MGAGLELTPVEEGTRLRLRVRPGARKNAILGPYGGALKVSVTAAPERGKANDAVVELLATVLLIPASSIRIVSGHSSSAKVVLLELEPDLVARRLGVA